MLSKTETGSIFSCHVDWKCVKSHGNDYKQRRKARIEMPCRKKCFNFGVVLLTSNGLGKTGSSFKKQKMLQNAPQHGTLLKIIVNLHHQRKCSTFNLKRSNPPFWSNWRVATACPTADRLWIHWVSTISHLLERSIRSELRHKVNKSSELLSTYVEFTRSCFVTENVKLKTQ